MVSRCVRSPSWRTSRGSPCTPACAAPARARSTSSTRQPQRRTMAARALAPLDLAVPSPPALAPPAPADLDTGLVGHWSFDDFPGSAAARDLSGRGHDCLLRGIDVGAAWGPGRAGGA